MRALAVIALAACATTPTANPVVASHSTTVTVANPSFPDNPMVDFVPAETPYVFASFKPIPLAVLRKMIDLGGPTWRRGFDGYLSSHSGDPKDEAMTAAILAEMARLDLGTLDQYGFSSKARFVAYGIGPWPVFRIELSSGQRVFDHIQAIARRGNQAMPPPIERAGKRYWVFGTSGTAYLVALAPTEMVIAVAPRATIDANLATILGDRPPANHLTSAQLRTLAERDQFSGQGVGYIDLARVATLVSAGATPQCRTAIEGVAAQVPRIALGYEDFAVDRIAFGVVVELARGLREELRGLSTTLTGVDRALAGRHAMAMVAAADLPRMQVVAGHAAGSLEELGRSCELSSFVDRVADVAATVAKPLPALLAGLHGGYFVVDDLVMTNGSPTSIDGFAMIELDNTVDLLKLAGSLFPNLEVHADHLPYPLPSGLPIQGHVAASDTAVGIAVGRDSAKHAVAVLNGKRATAPLATIEVDYTRLGDAFVKASDADAESQRAMMKALGRVLVTLLVDSRGLVGWMSIELR